MTVVATYEFHDLVASGCCTGQPYRRHGGFGAARDESDPLQDGHASNDFFSEQGLGDCGRTKGTGVVDGINHRLTDRGMPMTEDHRTPRANEVDVAIAVDVCHPGALTALEIDGSSADGMEGSHGGTDSTRDYLSRTLMPRR